ncbi:MAG: iron ABC transporter permease [Kineosporiaceae bacterium]|nr:iron ABC transporter permease [Kineosporiaceae bacterium]
MNVVQQRRPVALAAAGALLLLALVAGTSVGAVALSPSGILASLAHSAGLDVGNPLSQTQFALLTQIRIPRVLLAALVGGMLALAGASYQGVFRNPLADPYLLGAAAGAGLGATIVIAYSPNGIGPIATLPMAAFVGALTGVGLSYALGAVAARHGGGSATLLLAGIAVTAFLTAIQTVVQQANSDSLRQVYSWILGQLGAGHWDEVRLVLPYMAVSTVVLLFAGRALDVLSVGDDEAITLGVRPRQVRFVVLLAASLGTASAVAVSGLIGFVGLVVPHVVRRLAGSSYRSVLPVSLLAGGAFLVLADLVARTVLSPAELPIGVVTAFVGAPFFAALLRIGGGSS